MGAYVVAAASRFPRLSGGYPGPGLFPQLLGVLLCLQAVLLVLASGRGREGRPTPLRRDAVLNVVLAVLAVGLYVAASPRLGFLLTSAAVLTGLMVRLGAGLGRSLVLGPAMSVGLYLLFGKLLRVPLPRGLLSLW